MGRYWLLVVCWDCRVLFVWLFVLFLFVVWGGFMLICWDCCLVSWLILGDLS